jgi:hypothetical protein
LNDGKVEPGFSIRTVIDETTSHSTKPPKDGGKWLVIPRRRESSKKNSPRSGQSTKVDLLRRHFSINWIPAFAGMTAEWIIWV